MDEENAVFTFESTLVKLRIQEFIDIHNWVTERQGHSPRYTDEAFIQHDILIPVDDNLL